MNGWLGEVEGLQVSLDAAKAKLTSLDRSINRMQSLNNGPTHLGLPLTPHARTEPMN